MGLCLKSGKNEKVTAIGMYGLVNILINAVQR
jgi:hypothetical protein